VDRSRIIIILKQARLAVRNFLRFANLLEPDRPYMVLSLSKLSVWLTLGLTVYVTVSGTGLAEMGAALIANMGAISNYAWRRKLQVETRTGGYADNYTDGMPISDIHEGPL
jgi:hypothetical protein